MLTFFTLCRIHFDAGLAVLYTYAFVFYLLPVAIDSFFFFFFALTRIFLCFKAESQQNAAGVGASIGEGGPSATTDSASAARVAVRNPISGPGVGSVRPTGDSRIVSESASDILLLMPLRLLLLPQPLLLLLHYLYDLSFLLASNYSSFPTSLSLRLIPILHNSQLYNFGPCHKHFLVAFYTTSLIHLCRIVTMADSRRHGRD